MTISKQSQDGTGFVTAGIPFYTQPKIRKNGAIPRFSTCFHGMVLTEIQGKLYFVPLIKYDLYFRSLKSEKKKFKFLISSFRRVLYVVCFLLGN